MKSEERFRERHNVFQLRWGIPILGAIYDLDGAKFITLVNKLGISRSVLTSTLGKLIEEGLIIRNPGYGHPLRPEYLLTGKGKNIAAFCRGIMIIKKENQADRLVHSRWALRILLLLTQKDTRFSGLKSKLTPITSRALSEELKLLAEEGYIKRRVIDDYPPASLYAITSKSAPFTTLFTTYERLLKPFTSSV